MTKCWNLHYSFLSPVWKCNSDLVKKFKRLQTFLCPELSAFSMFMSSTSLSFKCKKITGDIKMLYKYVQQIFGSRGNGGGRGWSNWQVIQFFKQIFISLFFQLIFQAQSWEQFIQWPQCCLTRANQMLSKL